ncbi:MAG: hypothetical protein ACOH1X_09845 [Kaistella sp.]
MKKLKIIRTLLLLSAFLFVMSSCTNSAPKTQETSTVKNSAGEILSISMTRTAGRGGSTRISATPDSLIFEAGRVLLKEQPSFRKKMNSAAWAKLTSLINTDTLEKTNSGEGRGHYDGPDFIVHIVTKDKEYNFVNVPEKSAGYQQIVDLEGQLNSLVSEAK